MRSLLSVFILLGIAGSLSGQCLTDFKKLVPDAANTYSEDFGGSLSIYDDIMAVGESSSDSLGRVAGIVYLYKKEGERWKRLGVLKPSDPVDGLGFGRAVKVTAKYILVASSLINNGIYVFRKPGSGWETANETWHFTQVNTKNFGSTFDISADGNTLVISDMTYETGTGGFFVYHKRTSEEWEGQDHVQYVPNPHSQTTDFAYGGVKIIGTKIACAANYTSSGNGAIYMYGDNSGDFDAFELEGILRAENHHYFNGRNFAFSEEGVFTFSMKNILYYAPPSGGEWQDAYPSCIISLTGEEDLNFDGIPSTPVIEEDQLIFPVRMKDKSGRIIRIKRLTSDWCGAVSQELIYQEPIAPALTASRFGYAFASYNQTEIACSWVVPDDLSMNAVGIAALSRQGDGSFDKQTLTKRTLTAAKFSLGVAFWQTGDYIFANALGERTLERDSRGTVYIYKKESGSWKKVNKLDQFPVHENDKNFGSLITGYKNYLAIAASGYKPHGKIFIYENLNDDWARPTLRQAIDLPEDAYITTIGDLAMWKNWMVVSTVTNSPSQPVEALLLFYRRSGDTWSLDQRVSLGSPNIFGKAAAAIDMDNETLVAGSYARTFILEYDATTTRWGINHHLTATDPDRDVLFVDPKYGTFTFDGSRYGFDVKIDGNRIFVSAPLKNENGVLDVGAVYVYVRKPGTPWTSMTETVKLVPKDKSVGMIFGYSMSVFRNSLLVGAPANEGHGRAFLMQASDYYWRKTVQLIELSGNTFSTDSYGFAVGLDEDDFIISAPMEDNESGRLAGTVYVTEPPPMFKPEPPACLVEAPRTLEGYPFGGSWSGPGITDAINGLFDPAIAGTGVHELTYVTPNCFYEGKMRIEVTAPPQALLDTAPNLVACSNGNVTIKMVPVTNVSFSWFFRESENLEFAQIAGTGSTQIVSQPGQYQAAVSNEFCSSLSEITTVVREDLDVTISAPLEVCRPDETWVSFESNHAGGTWSLLNGISNFTQDSKLNVASLADNAYQINYRYTSANNCVYNVSHSLLIDRIRATITRTGNLCANGSVTLATPSMPRAVSYNWSMVGEGNEQPLEYSHQNTIGVYSLGTYRVQVERENCAVTLDPIVLNDTFETTILPEAPNSKTCSLTPFYLKLGSDHQADTHEWFFSEVSQAEPTPLTVADKVLEVKKTGYYFAQITRGACRQNTDVKFVEFSPPDTLFVPNFFTPNNDGHNDVFRAYSSLPEAELRVVNRYGTSMFQGNAFEGWRGEGASVGTYHWYVTYRNCKEEPEQAKGFVQLAR